MANIFFTEDIRNALLAANEANTQMAMVISNIADVCKGNLPGHSLADLRAYQEGYRAALVTIALAFGLSPSIFEKTLEIEERRK